MLKIALCGALGHMGKVIAEKLKTADDIKITAGIDKTDVAGGDFPIFSDINKLNGADFDVIVDFSHPSLLESLLRFAKANKKALVLATTGYSEEQISTIKQASESVAVFFTFNMSLGINLLSVLAKKTVDILGNAYDVEIIEKHHNQKIDAPSGTALMLANVINAEFDGKMQYEYDRHSKRAKRSKNEIGIHSVRGGTIVGEHEIIFAGDNEVITLSHSAQSKTVFAEGAIRAAKFISDKPAGLYDMNDMLG